jgi:hypothetical protein
MQIIIFISIFYPLFKNCIIATRSNRNNEHLYLKKIFLNYFLFFLISRLEQAMSNKNNPPKVIPNAAKFALGGLAG